MEGLEVWSCWSEGPRCARVGEIGVRGSHDPPSPALNRSAAARVVAHTAPQSGRRISAPRARTPRGAPIGGPALPSCRRVRILCERDPLCPVPSPLHAAMRPLPLALAKILQRWGRVCPQPSPSLGCPSAFFLLADRLDTGANWRVLALSQAHNRSRERGASEPPGRAPGGAAAQKSREKKGRVSGTLELRFKKAVLH